MSKTEEYCEEVLVKEVVEVDTRSDSRGLKQSTGVKAIKHYTVCSRWFKRYFTRFIPGLVATFFRHLLLDLLAGLVVFDLLPQAFCTSRRFFFFFFFVFFFLFFLFVFCFVFLFFLIFFFLFVFCFFFLVFFIFLFSLFFLSSFSSIIILGFNGGEGERRYYIQISL